MERLEDNDQPDQFASYFDEKIKAIINTPCIDDSVYNGRKKVESLYKIFMDQESIRDCVLSLQVKNSEGFDRIPQRIGTV